MTIDHLIVCLANDKQLETSTSILDYYIEKFTSCIITEHGARFTSSSSKKYHLMVFIFFLQKTAVLLLHTPTDVPHLNFCVTKVVMAILNGTYAIYGLSLPLFITFQQQLRLDFFGCPSFVVVVVYQNLFVEK